MKNKLFRLVLVIALIWIFFYVNNHWLQVSSHEIVSDRIPKPFDGLVIVQLSDLHDAEFGKEQFKLAEKVKELNPDLIFITGDLIDSNRYDLEKSLNIVRKLVDFADVYYVTGNHEISVNRVDEITRGLQSLGVKVLNNETNILERNGEQIVIAGVKDPLMDPVKPDEETTAEFIDHALNGISEQNYCLMLSHRPEVFDVYVDRDVDLIFTGHAHGGQVRIPGLGGLMAPGQGWFPKYTAGVHTKGMTTMVVSRGLGNSIIPYRIFNRPEIIAVTLKKE
ncbi:MAG TPA: metallophosphoesterase [Bacillus bacterium]|uniref:Phosphoesterase n=1 Tax=Siminovitchia fordii TaxID=254759 RepID=A0ABQ4K3U9_9BACI|nr:metallophosphoesterase [Siminovitchia fordii]GIN19596.1 phosphoesterase [Siminovitchia fordii]HBZ11495.1 metallophosphoesterase [Bacillus sp. (in: firmicutes)]